MSGICFLSTDDVCLFPSELKDNLGNDEPEGDMPVLLQTLLSRNPKIFRDKSRSQHTATVTEWQGCVVLSFDSLTSFFYIYKKKRRLFEFSNKYTASCRDSVE